MDEIDLGTDELYCMYCNTHGHKSRPYCMLCKTHDHEHGKCQTKSEKKEKVVPLGERSDTQPPRKKGRVKPFKPPDREEQKKERGKVIKEIHKVTTDPPLEPKKELHWDYGDDPKSKEIFERYYKPKQRTQAGEKGTPKNKMKTTLPNIYCEDCKKKSLGAL